MDDVEAGTSPSPAKEPGSAADAEHQPELDGDGAEGDRRTGARKRRRGSRGGQRRRKSAAGGGRRRGERRRRPRPGHGRRRRPADQPELPENPREGRLTPEVAERTLVRKPQIGDTRPGSGRGRGCSAAAAPVAKTVAEAVAPQAVVARAAGVAPRSCRPWRPS